VRRQEELVWLAAQGFTHVLSLLDSPHNLHAYDEAHIAYEQLPVGRFDELPEQLGRIYARLQVWMDDPTERILVHHEEFGDKLMGVLAGYLLYAGLMTEGPDAVLVVERLTGREIGREGRELVAITLETAIRKP
jgi:hypothetical protein